VHGLKASDFVVTSDLKPLSVVYSHEDKDGVPSSVLVAVDVSGSMHAKLDDVYPEIANVIVGLNSCDEVGLLAFSDRPILVQTLTTDHYAAAQRVPSLWVAGPTGLYDAINASAKIVAKGSIRTARSFLLPMESTTSAGPRCPMC
jgi:Mg-chelatase subunit ChlD